VVQVGQVVLEGDLAVAVAVAAQSARASSVSSSAQWSNWSNLWHSASIRSSIYTFGTPGRALGRRLRRDRTVA